MLFGRKSKPKRRRRRAARGKSPAAQQRQREQAQRALDRKAAAWVRQDNARRERERARSDRQRVRLETRLMRGANRAERSHQRERAQLKDQGFSDAEIEQVRSYHYEDNPPYGKRGQRFKLALDFLQGRGEHARRNPSCETCKRNPSAGEAAATFHGHSGPGFTSGRKVVLGELTRINYRPPRGSNRGGAEWTHESGDVGIPFMRNRGRGKVLGDPNTGTVTVEMRGSGMKFEPGRGLVG